MAFPLLHYNIPYYTLLSTWGVIKNGHTVKLNIKLLLVPTTVRCHLTLLRDLFIMFIACATYSDDARFVFTTYGISRYNFCWRLFAVEGILSTKRVGKG